jgi:hypothetical protein
MTTILLVAQEILDESGFSLSGSGGSLTNIEYLIKTAVDYVNMETGANISFTPAAGVASLTASDPEIVAVKITSNLLLRARNEKGPNFSVSSISVSQITGDPHFTVYMKLLDKAVDRLRGRSFQIT